MAWTKVEQLRWEAVRALVLEKPEVFAVQGWVQTIDGRHRLRYREGKVVRSFSLGRSQELADAVAELLGKMHWAEQSRQYMKRLTRQAREGQRRALAVIDALLDMCGEPAEPPASDELDDDPLGNGQDPWMSPLPGIPSFPKQPPETHPTGGKWSAPERPFFDGVVPDLTQDQLAELLRDFESMLHSGTTLND